MDTQGFKRKLAAILSADVKGYSRLMGENDQATVRTITDYRKVVTRVVRKHMGTNWRHTCQWERILQQPVYRSIKRSLNIRLRTKV